MTDRDAQESFIRIGPNWVSLEKYRRRREALDEAASVLFVIFAGAMLLLVLGVM